MRKRSIKLGVLVIGIFLLLPSLSLAKKGKTHKAADTPKSITRLALKDMRTEIDPTFTFLNEVGPMIDEGRMKCDPNLLIGASLLLFYAEDASGKKSKHITGEAILKEATEMAIRQMNSKLLEKVDKIWKQRGDTEFDWKVYAMTFATRGSPFEGNVKVFNHSPYALNIYINSNLWTVVESKSTSIASPDIKAGEVFLYARGKYEDVEYGPRSFTLEPYDIVVWTLGE